MRFFGKLAFAAAWFLAVPLFAQQQEDSAPPQQQSAPASKTSSAKKPAQTPSQPAKKPSEAEQNPFPETQSEAAAHAAEQQNDQSAPSAPAPQSAEASPQQEKKPAEADQNPFPETQSEKAAGQDQPQGATLQKPGTQPSSSSGTPAGKDDSSSKLPGFVPPPDLDAGKADEGDGTTSQPALARKDTQVGRFYLQSGDYKGAYDRFAEAVRIDPGNADALFGLADAAQRLHRRDEAIQNYRLYLAALPDGPHAKEVRKALREMGVDPKS